MVQEDILADMAKTAASGGFALGALLGSGGGKKFKALDVKRVYFGNWLRDYSQVCLSALRIRGVTQICSTGGGYCGSWQTTAAGESCFRQADPTRSKDTVPFGLLLSLRC